MRSYLLKASDAEFDAWRAAAGGESLARWIRSALNAAQGPSVALSCACGASSVVPDPREAIRADMVLGLLAHPASAPETVRAREKRAAFKPDFKGQK
jgi:hypothetical protein